MDEYCYLKQRVYAYRIVWNKGPSEAYQPVLTWILGELHPTSQQEYIRAIKYTRTIFLSLEFLKFRIGSGKKSRQAQAPPCMHISFTVVLMDDLVKSITSNILFNHRNWLVMISISQWKESWMATLCIWHRENLIASTSWSTYHRSL